MCHGQLMRLTRLAPVAPQPQPLDGTYSITGLAPGSFQVFFDPTCGNTQSSPDFPLWYSNSLTEGGATSVTVSSGNTFTAIMLRWKPSVRSLEPSSMRLIREDWPASV